MSPRRGTRADSALRTLVLILFAGTALFAAMPPATGAPAPTRYLKLSIDSVNPPSVGAEPADLEVKATIQNVSDRPVVDLVVRMQRAAKISAESQLRSMLLPEQQGFDIAGPFEKVSPRLDPGKKVSFTITLPLHPGNSPSLNITEPGVYPVLLNVNATPKPGIESKLDEARFLLPVVDVPAAEPATVTKPSAAVTLLWPISDSPQTASGVPGSASDRVRLVDEDLAKSLVAGGRLNDMLTAVETAAGGTGDKQKRMASAMCLAIDPDLLSTVSSMTRGYDVLDDPAAPQGRVHPGTGMAGALNWLNRLRTLADSMCTIPMPFARTDITAVDRLDDEDLFDRAVLRGVDTVESILSVKTLHGVVWPGAGMIDQKTAVALRSDGVTAVLLARDGFSDDNNPANPVPDVVSVPSAPAPAGQTGPPLRGVAYDAYAASALAAVGVDPQTPVFTPERVRFNVAGDSRTARLQDALGAVSFAALTAPGDSPRGLFLAPPQSWDPSVGETRAILTQVSDFLTSGRAVARPLSALTGGTSTGPAASIFYSDRAEAEAPGDDIRGEVSAQNSRLGILQESMVDDPNAAPTPEEFLAPLRDELLRALATPGRNSASTADVRDASRVRRAQLVRSVDGMFHSVTVLAPSGVYTLASAQSPLPLVARNDLPVPIRVRIVMDPPPEMSLGDMGLVELPARGSRTLQIPTKVSANRKIVLPVELTTVTGHPLGSPAILTIRSNAYGQALTIITACAGALLLFLAGRRLWRRFRGQPDPADEGRAPSQHPLRRHSDE
ncbi:DUF6049 family protein [Smaragdicoccus niigatensis]|uniref:DUF6049 family protein n=1 Tax=Smaragdicoccus niigatensis TaxID=359359 RepID=UPI00037B9DD8|nr:DUF6049 family protein [Smaragdicoccus niigatensis]